MQHGTNVIYGHKAAHTHTHSQIDTCIENYIYQMSKANTHTHSQTDRDTHINRRLTFAIIGCDFCQISTCAPPDGGASGHT